MENCAEARLPRELGEVAVRVVDAERVYARFEKVLRAKAEPIPPAYDLERAQHFFAEGARPQPPPRSRLEEAVPKAVRDVFAAYYGKLREAAERAAVYLALVKGDGRYARKEVERARQALLRALRAGSREEALAAPLVRTAYRTHELGGLLRRRGPPSDADRAVATARPRGCGGYISIPWSYILTRAPIEDAGIIQESYGKPGPTFKNTPFPSGVRYLGGVRLLGVTCGPGVDPSMPIHADPRAWEGLLGRCADAFMEGVGTWSRTSRALRSFGAPSAARIPPAE